MLNRLVTSFTCALSLVMAARPCQAQSVEPTRIELAMDFRARIAAVGKSRTVLHTGSVRLRTGLAPGLRAEVYGADKYDGFLVQQAVVEKDWGAHRLQAGVIRIPFGIYDYQETYASGLIDYPLPRVDYGLHAVDWGVPGAMWVGGTPHVQVEAAGFEGRAAGVWSNRNNVGGGAARVQAFVRDLLLGASHWSGYFDTNFSRNRRAPVRIHGVDVRYARPHLLVRGEYLFGALGGEQMHGWYLDTYYHLPKYEKVTLAARLEMLRPGSALPLAKQVTLGVRYVAAPDWVLSVNWRRNNGSEFYALTWTPYAAKGGDLFFQVYRKIRL